MAKIADTGKQEVAANDEQALGVISSMEKMVPKMCSAINVALLKSKKNAILSLAYGDMEGELTIIERVAVDIDHLASLRDVLTKVLKDANYE